MTGSAAAGHRAWVEHIMGMPVSLHIRQGSDDPANAAAAEEAFALLRQVDRRFSTYRDDSEISRINRGTLRLGDAHPQVRAVARLCALARRRTGGYFDARLPAGAAVPGSGDGAPPPSTGPRFDPSGLVKGWAVQRAAKLLSRRGVADFCLNAGGDIVLRCAPGIPAWAVGVEDPADPSRLLGVLDVADGAVATSGTARRGTHIYDPHSGRAASGVSSVTVTGPDLTWADVYATAFAAGAGRSLTLPEPYRRPIVTTRVRFG